MHYKNKVSSQNTWESEIKRLLKEDVQTAMVLIVEHYTSLLWTISTHYLANPEDRKECVNDTFAAFYWQREEFDETKGSLSAFLCGIARHQAISHYRKNKRHAAVSFSEGMQDTEIDLKQIDDRLDLERALNTLNMEDAEIIRMKYYGGMTIKEIANSLNLPYETVKKRHQRSLGKMRLVLLALLILTLAVGLAACAYAVLQHFGFIPNYGINRSETMSFYVAESTASFKDDHVFIEIESGILSEDSLILTLYAEFSEEQNGTDNPIGTTEDTLAESELYFSSPKLLIGDGTEFSDLRMTSVSPFDIKTQDMSRQRIELIFEPQINSQKEHSIPAILCISDIELPFTFCEAKEQKLDAYSYALDKQGGLLAIPELQDGRLYVDIYPLNCGDYITEPGLIRTISETAGGPVEDITITGPGGILLNGTCPSYSPFSSHAFYRWDFGPAEAGDYLLHVPYVYQTAELPDEFGFTISDSDFKKGQRIEIPGSTLILSSYSKEQPEGTVFSDAGDNENAKLRRFLCFDIETKEPDRILADLNLSFIAKKTNKQSFDFSSSSSIWRQEDDYTSYLGYTMLLPEVSEAAPIEITGQKNHAIVTYRWNHPFSIEIHVNKEKK